MTWVLRTTDVFGPIRWRWLLEDAGGRAVADHEVDLAPMSVEYEAFCDPDGYLRRNAAPDDWVASEATIVARVGAWIGDQVLGPAIGAAIVAGDEDTVRVGVPAAADFLLDRPLDLAHAEGVPLARRGVSLVYGWARERQAGKERYDLAYRARLLAKQTRKAVYIRVPQYGVTRERLRAFAEEPPGRDVLHIAGHGEHGAMLLEKSDGTPDPVSLEDLVTLLRLARREAGVRRSPHLPLRCGNRRGAAALVQTPRPRRRPAGTAPTCKNVANNPWAVAARALHLARVSVLPRWCRHVRNPDQRFEALDQAADLRVPPLVRQGERVAPAQRLDVVRQVLVARHRRPLHKHRDDDHLRRPAQGGPYLETDVVVRVVEPPTALDVPAIQPAAPDHHQQRSARLNDRGGLLDKVHTDPDLVDVEKDLRVAEDRGQPVPQPSGVARRVLPSIADEDPGWDLRGDVDLLPLARLPEQQGYRSNEREAADQLAAEAGAARASHVFVHPTPVGVGQLSVPAGHVRVRETHIRCMGAAERELITIGEGVALANGNDVNYCTHG